MKKTIIIVSIISVFLSITLITIYWMHLEYHRYEIVSNNGDKNNEGYYRIDHKTGEIIYVFGQNQLLLELNKNIPLWAFFKVDDDEYVIPANQVKEFLKDFPNAEIIQTYKQLGDTNKVTSKLNYGFKLSN